MRVEITLSTGCRWHSRRVATIRDTGKAIEVAREHESPLVFPRGQVTRAAIQMDDEQEPQFDPAA